MPRICRARSISARRISPMLARMSGRSMAGLRIEPRSPPVQVATITSTPSATYLAVVAAPLLDSSSGWAWTCSSRKRSPAASNRSGGSFIAAHVAIDGSPTTRCQRAGRLPDARARRSDNGRHACDPERPALAGERRRRATGRRYPAPRLPRPVLIAIVAVVAAGAGELADLDGARARRPPVVRPRWRRTRSSPTRRIDATVTVDRPDPSPGRLPGARPRPRTSSRSARQLVPVEAPGRGRERPGRPHHGAPGHHRRGPGVLADLTARDRTC